MSEMKSLTLNDVRYDGFVDPVARALAGASAVIKPASGESITLPDSSGNKLYGLNIYGKTTQNGTPTPDAPVELVSLGKQGGVTVTVAGDGRSQNLVVETPNGLPGILVATGGNYTDANGQQWVCDEIDLERGVYVQRVCKKAFTGEESFAKPDRPGNYYWWNESLPRSNDGNLLTGALCNRLVEKVPDSLWNNIGYGFAISTSTQYPLHFRIEMANTTAELKTLLSDWHKSGNPLEIMFELRAPIEIPLSEDEIAAYNALRTYREGTTVTNDAGAYMDLEYAMDAKTYIDSVIAGATGTVRLTEVTLPATAWTGSDSLYSQVVAVDGITRYSKVDLLPSVEQLAIFHNKDVAFVTENEDGVVTVYAIGDKPTNDYVIQASITEVAV
jgi:hypothetical protein